MLKKKYFARLKALLFEKGISSRQSDHLIEELHDHFSLKIAEFQAQGNNSQDAERLAIESVGTPEAIAEKADADLQKSSWMMRYAWLLYGGGFFIVCIVLQIAIMWPGYYFSGLYGYDHVTRINAQVSLPILVSDTVLFNWLPLLIGIAILVFLIRFSSISWKSLFIAGIAIGIAASAMELQAGTFLPADRFPTAIPRIHLNFNIFIMFLFQSWERYRILHLFVGPYPIDIDVHLKRMLLFLMTISTLFKMFTPLGVCLFARYVQPHIAASKSAGKNLLKVSGS